MIASLSEEMSKVDEVQCKMEKAPKFCNIDAKDNQSLPSELGAAIGSHNSPSYVTHCAASVVLLNKGMR
jgi:hypothetical protein